MNELGDYLAWKSAIAFLFLRRCGGFYFVKNLFVKI